MGLMNKDDGDELSCHLEETNGGTFKKDVYKRIRSKVAPYTPVEFKVGPLVLNYIKKGHKAFLMTYGGLQGHAWVIGKDSNGMGIIFDPQNHELYKGVDRIKEALEGYKTISLAGYTKKDVEKKSIKSEHEQHNEEE